MNKHLGYKILKEYYLNYINLSNHHILRKPFYLIILLLELVTTSYGQITGPSSVCVNTPVIFTTPAKGTTFTWVFDTVNINQSPSTFTTSSVPSASNPTFATMSNDNGTWYSFITNYNNNSLVKLNFGSNPNGAFTASTVGTYGSTGTLEGVDIVKDDVTGNWYGFVVDGTSLIRLSFGTSLANAPTSTPMTFSSNLAWPHQFGIAKYGNQWVGFAANRNSSIARFDFGTSPANTPTATNLPTTNLVNPCNYAIYTDGTNWYMLVANLINATITRLSFGTNIQNNSPASVNLGNFSNLLSLPRSIAILPDCDQLYAYVQLEAGTLVRLNFNGNITNTPTAQNMGNTGITAQNGFVTYSYGGAKSVLVVSYNKANIYRANLLTFTAPNQIKYYTSSATHTFTTPGTYNVTLYCDDGNHGGVSSYCKTINVSSTTNLLKDTSICQGDAVVLDVSSAGGTGHMWNTGANTSSINVSSGGKYWVTVTGSSCLTSDTATITVKPRPNVDLGNDTAICGTIAIQLQNKDTVSPSSKHLWSTGDTTAKINVFGITSYWLQVTDNGCSSRDTVKVLLGNLPVAKAGNDTLVCLGDSIQLHGQGGTTYKWSSTGNTVFSKTDTASPVLKVLGPSIVTLTVLDGGGCSDTEKMLINIVGIDDFNVTPDSTKICNGSSILLTAAGGNSYVWWEENGLDSLYDPEITVSPVNDTRYYVRITEPKCNLSDTLEMSIHVVPMPDISLSKTNDIECSKGSTVLSATGADSYMWTPSDNLSNPEAASTVAKPRGDVVYTVVGTNENLCSDTDRITVKAVGESAVKINRPDAFTPDNNGLNDCYKIEILTDILDFELAIFNRWGNRVFYTETPGDCWDGTFNGVKQPVATYYYFYKAKADVCNWFDKGDIQLVR